MARTEVVEVERGTTYPYVVIVEVDGVPHDITPSTLLFTVKNVSTDDVMDDSSAILLKTVTSHTDPTEGKSEIVILPEDTRNLEVGTYYFSVKIDMLSDNTQVYLLSEGKFVIAPNTTNRSV